MGKDLIMQHPIRVLLLLLALIYSTGLNGQFVNDDITYFVYNDLLTSLSLWSFTDVFTHPSNYWGELLPLRDYFYVVQFHLFGSDPLGYHLVSLGLYLLIVALIVPLLESIAAVTSPVTDNRWQFIFVAAIFALNPLHVESVAYISGQKDLLCALFSLLCLLLFFRMIVDDKYQDAKLWCGFLACYYSAFLSKPLAVATAMLLTICGFMLLRYRQQFWTRLVPLWGLINIPAVLWFNFSLSVSAVSKGMAGVADISIVERVVRAVRILGQHFILVIWPDPLNFGYPFNSDIIFDGPFLAGSCSLLLLITGFIVCRDFLARFAILLILLYLLPVSQLFYDFFNASIYDRYLFVPLLGVGIIAGRIVSLLATRLPSRSVHLGAVMLLVALVLKTLVYIPVYSSDVSVARHAYENYPDWNSSSFNYASSLIEAGRFDQAKELIATETRLSQPGWVKGYLLGWIALEEGDVSIAISQLQQSFWQCVTGGYYPFPGVLLAKGLIKQGHEQQALVVLEANLKSKINNPLELYRAKRLKAQILGYDRFELGHGREQE